MTVYTVIIEGESKGQMFYYKDEAEKHAGYLNDIPNGVTYTVKEV
jgi:hypothetical protein